ncbi:uncharacterized protein LOC132713880, partial [Ruditapes philippinarum]|uniref:uncharacterized protein LOC132713880 n=1 Tax=Ruditapes philippinarum TaxID=129788 RepID=UPI00295BC74B
HYIQFLLQLKNNTIHISQEDIKPLIAKRKHALAELDDRTAESLRKLDEKAFDVLHKLEQDVDDLKRAALTDVENAGTSTKQNIYVEKHDAIFDIIRAREQAKQNISDNATAGVSDINKATEQAKQDISQKANTTRKQAKQDISEKANDGISDINTAKEQATQEIYEKATGGVCDINTARELAKQDISFKGSDVLSDINRAREQANQDIYEKGTGSVCELNRAREQAKQDIVLSATDGLSDIKMAREQAKQDVSLKVINGISDINTVREQSKEYIAGKTNDGLNKVSNAETEAIQHIARQATDTMSEVKQDIDMQKCEVMSDIRIAGARVKQDVLTAFSKAETDTQGNHLGRTNDARFDKSEGVILKESLFQRGFRRVRNVFSSSKSKPHLKVVPKRSRGSSFRVSELKDELIRWYNTNHSTVPLSPLTDDCDTPVAGFYILPEIDVHTHLPGGRKETTRVASLHDLFISDVNVPREIYLSAVAGFGKTAFSKYLTIAWCQAHQNNENYVYFEEEVVNALSDFSFLFLVFLRDSTEVCDVDDMIEQQVIQNLPCSNKMPKGLLKDLLRDEKCLVILDGLDEWTHPDNDCTRIPKSIPHRYAREKCVILTTTRPWKLGVSNLKTSQIDKTIELVEFNKYYSRQFKINAIKMLIGNIKEDKLRNKVSRFEEHIRDNDLKEMESTPLLLLYLICLWLGNVPIGNSTVGLYTGIIQLLLSRTEKIHGQFHSSCLTFSSNVPDCFKNYKHCSGYYMFLVSLGKLAFHTLLSNKKENSLVFDNDVAEKYLNQEDLKLSSLSGILSVNKVKTLVNENFRISFAHKTVQEYFLAIYVCFQNTSEGQEMILKECHCLQNILDMSKVFVFISNMNPKLMSAISSELMSVINDDEKTNIYRTMTEYHYVYSDPLQDIQDMYISCAKECQGNEDLKLCLQDFFIDGKCLQVNYFIQLQHLCQQNKGKIKSVMIHNKGICSVQEICSLFELSYLQNVEKLWYRGDILEEEMISLILHPLKCISVLSSKWKYDTFKHNLCPLSGELYRRLVKLPHLECLNLYCFTMTHEVMETLLNFLTSKKSMTHIELSQLYCSDHENTSCRGFNIDLSQHLHLKGLGLDSIPVSQFKMNVSLLEKCTVGNLYEPGVVSSYLSKLPAANKLQVFRCFSLKSSSHIDTMLLKLPLLLYVKDVWLAGINLDKRSITLSPEMRNLKLVFLDGFTMSCSVLYDLLKVINRLPQSVTIRIDGCYIKTEREFQRFRRFVKLSDKFLINHDGTTKSRMYGFEFKTAKLK